MYLPNQFNTLDLRVHGCMNITWSLILQMNVYVFASGIIFAIATHDFIIVISS